MLGWKRSKLEVEVLRHCKSILLRVCLCGNLIILALFCFFYSSVFYVWIARMYMLCEGITIIAFKLYINYVQDHITPEVEGEKTNEKTGDKKDGS